MLLAVWKIHQSGCSHHETKMTDNRSDFGLHKKQRRVLQMENPRLPSTFMLNAILPQLEFDLPIYNDQYDQCGLCKTQLCFTSSNHPDETNSDEFHRFSSGWCISIKQAHEDAAAEALQHLQNKMKLQIRDFSYTIMKKIEQRNHTLPIACQGYAKVLDTMLLSWSSMTYNIREAASDYKSLIMKYRASSINLSSRYTIDSLLCHIDAAHNSLFHMDTKNMTQIHDFYHIMSPLLKEFIEVGGAMARHDHTTSITRPVVLSPMMMLTKLLSDKDCPSPAYNHHTEPDGKITSCCIFYPSQDSSDYSNPVVMYGNPSWNITSAKKAAALRVLEYMDTDLEIALRDYNYHDKELEIDKNRALLNKRNRFEAAVFQTRYFFHQETIELLTTLGTLRANVAALPAIGSDHLLQDTFQTILEAVRDINSQLDAVVTKATNILEMYNSPCITRLRY